MKKIIITLGILIIIGSVVVITYNYLLTEKLTNEFLEQINNGEVAEGHSQQHLLMELSELDIAQHIYIKSQKFTFTGGRTTLGLEIQGHSFSLELVIRNNEEGVREIQFKNLEIISGYLVGKEQADTMFNYEIERDGEKIVVSSPLYLEAELEEIVRLLVVNKEVIAVSPLEEVTISKVMSFNGESVTGETEGRFTFADRVMRFGQEQSLYVGQQNVDLYIKKGQVVGIVSREKFIPEKVRVLVNSTGFSSLSHNQIKLYSDQTMEIYSITSETKVSVPKESSVTIDNNNTFVTVSVGGKSYRFEGRVYLKSQGKFYFHSIKRGSNNLLTPGYRGNLEIFTMENNMYLINELPLEEYLYGVVPSEMPTSFGLEALKIQAIAARTYAANNVYASSYRNYSAHVVDSVLNQVYNNTLESPLTNSAVDSTTGKVITYEEKIIDAKFFSTSSGYTAMAHEVWDAGGEFPSSKISYLVSRAQFLGNYNIGTEKAFIDFITDKTIPGYDSNSPFYRWEIEMSKKQLERSIENNLPDRHKAQPNSVLTLENGDYVSKEIPANPLGDLKEIKVIERGKGGNIMALDIIAQNGTYRILKEYNIRFTIRPICNESPVEIRRHDGSVLSNYSILPSAFIYFEHILEGENLLGVKIYGGGNGHGVGMSQYGVVGMLEAGFGKEEIIAHYYQGAKISSIY